MNNINQAKRVEALEREEGALKPPAWFVALAGMCGVAPDDVKADPALRTLEDLVIDAQNQGKAGTDDDA